MLAWPRWRCRMAVLRSRYVFAGSRATLAFAGTRLILPSCRRCLQADNINAIISASGNSVQSYWGVLFAKILAGQDLDNIIMKPGACHCRIFVAFAVLAAVF